MTVNDQTRSATLSDNASAVAFYSLLLNGPVTIEMHDYGNFEKVGPLGTSIVRSDEHITTTPGDIILEVKYGAFLPDVIRDLIQTNSARQQAFSKYGICRRFG